MKKKILIIFFAFITIIALRFALICWSFFRGDDHRMKERQFRNSLKSFLIENKTSSHLYIIFCFKYSDVEMKKYANSLGLSSAGNTCDTIPMEPENKPHDDFYDNLPIYKNTNTELPENFSLMILDSTKTILKKYDKASFDKYFNNPDKNKAGWFLNIQKINDTIDLVSEEH